MTDRDRSDISRWLGDLRQGDAKAVEALTPIVYDELRKLAAGLMQGERRNHTLDPTALVHEAWLRLVGPERDLHWESRLDFRAHMAQVMRLVLVDHARGRARLKRGGDRKRIALDTPLGLHLRAGGALDVVELHECLDDLASLSPRQERLAVMRIFGGLAVEETARILGTSIRTAHREWSAAKSWLRHRLVSSESHDA